MELTTRILSINESPTLAIAARASRMKAEGRNIISLSVGEPDFDTPQHIKDAAKRAIDAGMTRYTPVGGTPGLKKAVADKFKRENDLHYTTDEVIVGVGAKQCIFNLILAVVEPGDEVIIPAPYWVSYADIVVLAGGVPVIIPGSIEQGFRLQPQQLAAHITPRTKLLMLNFPNNPSGAMLPLPTLQSLGEVLLKHPRVLVATDDIYEHINLSNEPFANILNACPQLKPRTVVINGVSKAYAMTGWRIGFAAGPRNIIKAMDTLQSQSTSNPTAVSQAAAEEALNGPQDCIAPMVAAFRERHEFVVKRLRSIAGLKCQPADGSFYAFPDARQAINNLHARGKIPAATDMALGEYLLEKAEVSVVPGSAFGAEGYFRLSFAAGLPKLREALDRMEQYITQA